MSVQALKWSRAVSGWMPRPKAGNILPWLLLLLIAVSTLTPTAAALISAFRSAAPGQAGVPRVPPSVCRASAGAREAHRETAMLEAHAGLNPVLVHEPRNERFERRQVVEPQWTYDARCADFMRRRAGKRGGSRAQGGFAWQLFSCGRLGANGERLDVRFGCPRRPTPYSGRAIGVK